MTTDSTPNRPVWQAEKQDPALAEMIREALREVSDPELGLNVIQLGLIRDVVLEGGKVTGCHQRAPGDSVRVEVRR